MQAAADGDGSAAARLLPLVYEQLRGAAQKQMSGERVGHTLQPTALVHEAFVKLIGERRVPWQNRRHFYAAAAEAMRQILLDHARARGRQKRGGDQRRAPLSLVDVAESWDFDSTVSLDGALRRLEKEDTGIAEVVRLRFYAGLSIEATAEALDVSRRLILQLVQLRVQAQVWNAMLMAWITRRGSCGQRIVGDHDLVTSGSFRRVERAVCQLNELLV